MPTQAIPDRYRYAAIAHVMVDGASDAIEFYKVAFGARELFRIADPNGKIIHAEVSIGQSVVMVGDAEQPFQSPKALGGSSVAIHAYVEDVDAFSTKAIGSGAKEIQPLQDMFYGARQTMLEDPYGHIWIFLSHTEDLSPEEIVKRGQELLNN